MTKQPIFPPIPPRSPFPSYPMVKPQWVRPRSFISYADWTTRTGSVAFIWLDPWKCRDEKASTFVLEQISISPEGLPADPFLAVMFLQNMNLHFEVNGVAQFFPTMSVKDVFLGRYPLQIRPDMPVQCYLTWNSEGTPPRTVVTFYGAEIIEAD